MSSSGKHYEIAAVGRASPDINISQREQTTSTALGGALLALALSRHRSLFGRLFLGLVGGSLLYRGGTGHCHVYAAFGMNTTKPAQRKPGAAASAAMQAQGSLCIQESPDALYRFWREPQNLSRIMGDFVDISAASTEQLRWTVRSPLGRGLSWETRIVEAEPARILRWESLQGAELPNEGSVWFRPAPHDHSTEVTLRVRFHPPSGQSSAVMQRLGAAPGRLVQEALHRCKSLIENPVAQNDLAAPDTTRRPET